MCEENTLEKAAKLRKIKVLKVFYGIVWCLRVNTLNVRDKSAKTDFSSFIVSGIKRKVC